MIKIKESLFRFILKVVQRSEREHVFSMLKANPHTQIGKNFKIKEGCRFMISENSGSVTIGDDFSVRSNCSFFVGQDASLSIGKGVFMNTGCSVNSLESIEIGDGTLFGEDVKIYDHNHAYGGMADDPGKLKVEKNNFTTSRVVIGRDCWLGSNVLILKGVTIGDRVIIGAGCIIRHSILSDHIVTNTQNVNIKNMSSIAVKNQ